MALGDDPFYEVGIVLAVLADDEERRLYVLLPLIRRVFAASRPASGPSSNVRAILPGLSPVRWMTYEDGIC